MTRAPTTQRKATGPIVRCSLFVLLALIPVTVFASSATPASATTRSLVIKPATGLTDHQQVEVTGSGFTPGDAVYLIECQSDATGASGCDLKTITPVTISSTGALLKTAFKVVTGKVGNGTCGTKPSNLKKCDVDAGDANGGDTAVGPVVFKKP